MPRSLFIGRSTIDVVSVVDTFPPQDGKVTGRATYVLTGGSSLNAALTHAHLGGQAILASSLGRRSPFLPLLLEEAKSFGMEAVDICEEPDFRLPVSTIISTIDTASRLIVNSAQAECTATRRMPELFAGDLSAIQIDQYERFFVRQHAELIRDFTGPVILDGGGWKDWSPEFLALAKLPIVSEGFFPGGASAFAADCGARGIAQWAVTLGKDGVLYHDHGTTAHIEPVAVEAIDTLGAGDIFHGAFCFYFGSGRSFADALCEASKVATHSCTMLGTRAWMEKN